MGTDDKLTHIASMISNGEFGNESNTELLAQVQQMLSGIQIQKDAPVESEDITKIKDTLADLRRKNIELRRQNKEISEQFLSTVKNPSEQ
jgi:hypothetical protein